MFYVPPLQIGRFHKTRVIIGPVYCKVYSEDKLDILKLAFILINSFELDLIIICILNSTEIRLFDCILF